MPELRHHEWFRRMIGRVAPPAPLFQIELWRVASHEVTGKRVSVRSFDKPKQEGNHGVQVKKRATGQRLVWAP